MKRELPLEIICSFLFLLFIYTGLSKLVTYKTFVWDLGRDPMIGPGIAHAVGVALPAVELAVGTMVIIPRWRRWGLYAYLVLMAMFTVYVRWMLHSPVRHCTCGGVLREMTWRQHFWFNVAVTIVVLFAIYLYRSIATLKMSNAHLKYPPPDGHRDGKRTTPTPLQSGGPG